MGFLLKASQHQVANPIKLIRDKTRTGLMYLVSKHGEKMQTATAVQHELKLVLTAKSNISFRNDGSVIQMQPLANRIINPIPTPTI